MESELAPGPGSAWFLLAQHVAGGGGAATLQADLTAAGRLGAGWECDVTAPLPTGTQRCSGSFPGLQLVQTTLSLSVC